MVDDSRSDIKPCQLVSAAAWYYMCASLTHPDFFLIARIKSERLRLSRYYLPEIEGFYYERHLQEFKKTKITKQHTKR